MLGRPPDDPLAQSSAVHGRFCPTCGKTYTGGGLRFCPTDGSELLVGSPASVKQAGRATSALIGQVLADRYRILRKVGEGGMGEVFEAQHVYIDKRFAVKTLRPEVTTSPEALARFHQEARAASTIGHENIVEVDDFGRLPDGGVYLAMEYLEGAPLGARMHDSPPLPRDEGVGYLVQACRGLAAAHDKGIVHRDVKPDNIFLARKSGKVVAKVLDFGIAKVAGGGASVHSLTQTGAVFGTPYYMSPEQALGRPLDARTDIYSIGVILYELCTGRVPFDGESFMGILSQHITAPPPPPRRVAPDRDIPAALEQVILRAMAKQPEGRFPSMAALADELERILRGAGEVTQPLGAAKSGSVRVADAASSGRSRSGGRAAQPTRVPTAQEILEAPPLELESARAPEPEPEIFDEVPAGTGRGRRWLAVAAALIALAGAAVAVVAMRGSSAKAKPGGDAPARSGAAGANDADEERSAPANPGDATKAGAELRAVFLETTPSGAQILDEQRTVGTTPAVVQVPAGGTRALRLVRDGYAPRQVILTTREPRVVVSLEHLPHKGRPPKPHPEPAGFKPGPGEPGDSGPYEALPPPPPPPPAPPAPRTPPAGTPLNPY